MYDLKLRNMNIFKPYIMDKFGSDLHVTRLDCKILTNHDLAFTLYFIFP